MIIRRFAPLVIAIVVVAGCADDEPGGPDGLVRAPASRPGYEVAVEPGETLEHVARRFNISVEALAEANHLEPPYNLGAYQSVIIPPPESYRVRAGDTVEGIATALGVDQAQLARANGLQEPYHMRIGQILTIPGGIGGEPAPGRRRAAPEPGFEGFNGSPPTPRSAISVKPLAAPSSTPAPPVQQPAPATGPAYGPPETPVPGSQQSAPGSPPHNLTPPPGAVGQSATALAPPVARQGDIVAPTPILPSQPRQAVATPAPPAVATANPAPAASAAPPRFMRPVSGQTIAVFGSISGKQANDGINIAAAAGTPVRAAEAGTIIYTGNELAAFGNLVLIRHGDHWVTAYGHLGSVAVQRNQTVTKGQPIGTVGQTGSVTAPQLHFEVRQNGKAVDPAPYLGG